LDKNAVYIILKEIMVSEFEIETDSIRLENRLYDDLKLDSLDMVDLILNLKNHTDKKIDPALFKNACTVQDLVDLIHPVWG